MARPNKQLDNAKMTLKELEHSFGGLSTPNKNKAHQEIVSINLMLQQIADISQQIVTKISNKSREKGAPVDVVEVLRHMCTKMQSDDHKVALLCRPRTALCFHSRESLERIFQNVIGNALKYSKPGKKEVEVSLDVHGNNIVICVDDRGIGIPAQEIDHLFQPFFRASNAKKHGVKGTGIGLYSVKALLEVFNGKINIKPNSYGGTRVEIMLPTLQSHYSRQPMLTKAKGPSTSANDEKYRLNIATLAHDILNLLTKLQLRIATIKNPTQQARTAKIVEKLQTVVSDIIATAKQHYTI